MATAPVGFRGTLQSRLYLWTASFVGGDAILGLAKGTASAQLTPWIGIPRLLVSLAILLL